VQCNVACARKCCCIFRVRDKSRRVTRECKNFRCPGALDTKATMPSTSARVGIVSSTLQERRTFRGSRERRRCSSIALPVVSSINFRYNRTNKDGADRGFFPSSISQISRFARHRRDCPLSPSLDSSGSRAGSAGKVRRALA